MDFDYSPRCRMYIVMGKSNPDAGAANAAVIVVPAGTPGIAVKRTLPVPEFTPRR